MTYSHERIGRVNGYAKDAYTYVPVAIVGAGESGIAMGCRLKTVLGFDQFRIYDRQSGVGGTWWINRYPGVACDVPALLYSFSFAQNPNWTELFPGGPEIQKYFSSVCSQFGIHDKIELNTEIEEARWDEDEKLWIIKLVHLVPGIGDLSARDKASLLESQGPQAVFAGRELVKAKVLISSVGGLVEPRAWPDNIKGRENFEGPVFHSARWDSSVDFQDKNVVVLGTGCSAAQLVPQIVKAPYNAKSVLHLMRSPPWVFPRPKPVGGDDNYKKFAALTFKYIPGYQATLRFFLFLLLENSFRLFADNEYALKKRAALEAKLIRHIQCAVPEKYHEMLTPDYSVGCKRRIFDATWFPSLNNPKIELSTQPLTSVSEHSVTIGPGRTYPRSSDSKSSETAAGLEEREVPADIIVLANGFNTTKWGHPLRVVGRTGQNITEVMDERGGMQAYEGIAMDGFPNFFMLFGPNAGTGHTSAIINSENGVAFAIKFVRRVLSGEAEYVEVKRSAEEAYTRKLQRDLKDLVWSKGGCSSWYTNEDWNGTVYPYSQIWQTYRCMFPTWSDWDVKYTSKGLLYYRLRKTGQVLALALALVGAWKARQIGLAASVQTVMGVFADTVRRVLDQGIRLLSAAKSVV